MFQFLYPKSRFDQSPLQFQKADWLRTRLHQLYTTYIEYKRTNLGRVASNHLLMDILNSLTVPFEGDLIKYIDQVEQISKRLAGTFRLTTSAVRGDVFLDVFYKNVNQVITCSRGDIQPIDLWYDWRAVAPVTVSSHPYTEFELFDPLVMNTPQITNPNPLSYAQINIDIPMLAAQYRMFKASYPNGTKEQYLSQIVLPPMMRSHIDLVLFNKVCVELGVMVEGKVRTNLPFGQPNLDNAGDALAKEIVAILLNKSLTPSQVISTIPAFMDTSNALYAAKPPSLLISAQSMWAIHSQSVDKANLVLEVCSRRGMYERALVFLARIKRDNIQLIQEGHYRNGLSPTTQLFLMTRWESVLSRVPMETFESLDLKEMI